MSPSALRAVAVLVNEILESDVPINSYSSIPSDHDELVHNLYSCLIGIVQPLALPPLPLLSLKD